MDALGHQRFTRVSHETGMPIGYALAADHPDRLDRLAVAEPPGVVPSRHLLGSTQINDRLWHIVANPLTEVNEQRIKGRDDIYLRSRLATEPARPLPDDAVKYHIGIGRTGVGALRNDAGPTLIMLPEMDGASVQEGTGLQPQPAVQARPIP
jgi:pimeloyl-ACP methyl ester carboxylesterase